MCRAWQSRRIWCYYTSCVLKRKEGTLCSGPISQCTDEVCQGTKTLFTVQEAIVTQLSMFSVSSLNLLESLSICQIQIALQISQAGQRCVNEQISQAWIHSPQNSWCLHHSKLVKSWCVCYLVHLCTYGLAASKLWVSTPSAPLLCWSRICSAISILWIVLKKGFLISASKLSWDGPF